MKKDYVATIDNYVIVIHNSPDDVDAALEAAWSENPELEEFEVENANVDTKEKPVAVSVIPKCSRSRNIRSIAKITLIMFCGSIRE